jgi:hypothetical protein
MVMVQMAEPPETHTEVVGGLMEALRLRVIMGEIIDLVSGEAWLAGRRLLTAGVETLTELEAMKQFIPTLLLG